MARLFRQHFLFFGSIFLAALFILSATLAGAQESTVTFPVPELGNCKNKEACHAYCDDLAHVNECVAFAESHDLMSADEARGAREFARIGGKGPSGCTSRDSCEDYCEDPAHIRQCLDFAKQAGLMDEHELQEAEKVAAYLEDGGAMPGECRGERECKAYCESGEHMEECAEFAIKAGFMSEKDAEIFRKTGGKGPGGCRGKECESYCEDESHRDECVAFALEHDLMSEEDKQRMEEGKEKAKQALEKAPPAVLSCIEAAIGAERLGQLKRGEGFAGPALGEILPRCFREIMGSEQHSGPFSQGVPGEALDCMRQIFGADFEERMKKGEIDPGEHDDEIRACMEKQLGKGFLSDEGRWERPQSGEPPPEGGGPSTMWKGETGDDAQRTFEEEGNWRQHPETNDIRAHMEERMRAEIESQMRSGNFDNGKLPPDLRPEGVFLPPEAYSHPPEGMVSPEGMMPPERSSPPPESSMPPPEFQSSPPEAFKEGPQSLRPATSLLANVLSVIMVLFGVR